MTTVNQTVYLVPVSQTCSFNVVLQFHLYTVDDYFKNKLAISIVDQFNVSSYLCWIVQKTFGALRNDECPSVKVSK